MEEHLCLNSLPSLVLLFFQEFYSLIVLSVSSKEENMCSNSFPRTCCKYFYQTMFSSQTNRKKKEGIYYHLELIKCDHKQNYKKIIKK